MNPDEDGNITMENFVHAFSLAYWTPESVAAMHNVLITNPDIIAKLADWKDVLRNLGMEMSDTEVNTIIQQAQVRATELLSAELSKSPSYSVEDKEEVHRKSGEILHSIRAKLSGMDIRELSNAGSGESGSKDPSGEINSMTAKLSGMDIHVLPGAGSGESHSTDPSGVSGPGEDGATSHPETPLFPAVPDKLEAEDQKESQVLKTD
uniref:Calmodulin n=1 Tax=Lygus hesperus TaxID=30085 RepID=A0A0A9YYA1_LYGHE